MPYESTLTLLTFGLAYVIGKVLYTLYFCPLRDVPGPSLARFTSLWEALRVLRGKSHEDYVRLHEIYGPVVRMGPNRISFNGPEAMTIYRKRLPKSNYYDAFGDPSQPNMLSMKDDEEHVERKRNFIRSYSIAAVRKYDSAANDQTKLLLQKLSAFDAQNSPVSMTHWLKLYTFGIITTITIGQDVRGLESGTDSTGILTAISAAVRYSAVLGLFPRLHHIIVKATSMLGMEAPIISLLNTAKRAARKFDDLRRDSPKTAPHAPFLEQLFNLYDEKKTDFRAIHDCCSSNIAAGSDTTAITISAALYLLHQEPDKLNKLREEIDGCIEDSRLVTVNDVLRMPYLASVVQETLRLHPAVGSMLPRVTPKGGLQLADRYFPEGTVVGVNAWAVHYNKAIYGTDAAKFRPERWREPDKSLPSPFAFGFGVRRCIGEHLGLMMASKGIAEIVRNFDLDFTSGQQGWEVNCAWFVWPNYSCHVRARDR